MAKGRVRIRWFGRKYSKGVQREMHIRLGAAAEFLRAKTVKNVSSPQPPSEPGEFPHADIGTLRQEMFWDYVSDLVVKVGTPLRYGLYLEVGTKNMEARPYLRRTLSEEGPTIRRMLTKFIPSSRIKIG